MRKYLVCLCYIPTIYRIQTRQAIYDFKNVGRVPHKPSMLLNLLSDSSSQWDLFIRSDNHFSIFENK